MQEIFNDLIERRTKMTMIRHLAETLAPILIPILPITEAETELKTQTEALMETDTDILTT